MHRTVRVGKSLWAVRTSFMKKIKLTKGKFALVDDEDFEKVNAFKWQVRKSYTTEMWYAERKQTIDGSSKKVNLCMHRFIMNITDKDVKIDHFDRNGLNNQKLNLRPCNSSQNGVNRKSVDNRTSKYLGVSWDGSRSRWRAATTKYYKQIHIGRFITEKEAALAYNKKAFEVHGEFANLNKV